MANENKYQVNWEKVGVYIAIAAAFFTVINHIIDLKERVARAEIEIKHFEEKKQ
jgi:hypothetical protein